MLRKLFENKKVNELECVVLDLLKRVEELEAINKQVNERRKNKKYNTNKSFNKPQKLATT